MNTLSESMLVYPARKQYLRVQSLEKHKKVIHFHDGSSECVSLVQALALELCSGEYNIASIVQICAESLRLPVRQVEMEIVNILIRYSKDFDTCLSMHEMPVFSNPLRILSKGKRTGITNSLRDDYPYTLTFSLTYACNHRCRYCCNSSGKALKNELRFDEWIRIIDEAAELGVMGITFSGGEPSMAPRFTEIIRRTVDRGIYPTISTNGSNLTEKSVAELASAGAKFIHLSLSAVNEDVYDNIEGCTGNFPKAIATLRNLKKNGFTVRVKAVIMSVNIQEFASILDLCYAEGVDAVHLEPFRLTHISREGQDLLPSAEEIAKVISIAEEKRKIYGHVMRIYAPDVNDLAWKGPSDQVRCGGVKSELTILSNGDVTFCEALAATRPELSIGNVRSDSLADLWYSDKPEMVTALDYKKIEEPCRSCTSLESCRTGCFMCSLIYSDNPWSIDPRCWKATNIKNNAFRKQLS